MKVVINTCYGGFGLSSEAMLLLYKRGSKIIEAHEPAEYYGNKEGWQERFLKDQMDIGCSWGANVLVAPDGKILTDRYGDEYRADEELVKVVEVMGEKADGWAAKLKVVTIPDGIKWYIDDYDGVESIEEEHRSWD